MSKNKESLVSLPSGSSESTPAESSNKCIHSNGKKNKLVVDASQPGPSFYKTSEPVQELNLRYSTLKGRELSQKRNKCRRLRPLQRRNSDDEPTEKQQKICEVNSDHSNEGMQSTDDSCNSKSGEESAENGKRKKFDETQATYLPWLPVPIIETILCHFSLSDVLSFRLVSKTWNEIIGNPKFLQWKKAYYNLKLRSTKKNCFKAALSTNTFEVIEDCIPSLITFMTSGFLCSIPPEVPALKNNPKYQLALDVIAERFTTMDPTQINVWTILAMLVVLAETAEELEAGFNCLIQAGSPLSICDVVNAMYCMATFFLYFIRKFKINNGFHYRLYYVIHTFENSVSNKLNSNMESLYINPFTSEQTVDTDSSQIQFEPSPEQMKILSHQVREGEVIKVTAFAGTGKTTVLVNYAKLHPHLKFLNIVCNKSVKNLSMMFPPNVDTKAIFNLAYKAVGQKYRHKLYPSMRPHDIVLFMDKSRSKHVRCIFTFAKMVLDTISNFCSSPDKELTLDHVPSDERISLSRSNSDHLPFFNNLSSNARAAILLEANVLWKRITDKNKTNVKMDHDICFKLHQLTEPKYTGYDCIIVDDASEFDAAMLDILCSQDIPVILVGDPNQKFFAFKKTKDSFRKLKAHYTYSLTKSYRFGPEIGYVATSSLEVLRLTSKNTIVGAPKPDFIDGRIEGQYAIISRNSTTLLAEAERFCCTEERFEGEPENIVGAFVGGLSSHVADLVDIYNLWIESDDIKDQFYLKFHTLESLCDYAIKTKNDTIVRKISFVKKKGEKLLEIIEAIKEKCDNPLNEANVVFSTVHNAKGFEFDTVYITNDFAMEDIFKGIKTRTRMVEEHYLLYVAITRAKRCLVLSVTLVYLLQGAQEKFETIKSSDQVFNDKASLQCICCLESFIPQTCLTLFRKSMSVPESNDFTEGPKCMKCACRTILRLPFCRNVVQVFRRQIYCALNDKHHMSLMKLIGPRPGEMPLPPDWSTAAERAEVL